MVSTPSKSIPGYFLSTAMSGFISKSRIPTRSHNWLPPAAKRALAEAKNDLRAGLNLEPFGNNFGGPGDGPPLPKVSQGCDYFEIQVGNAHPGDQEPAGRFRLVLEVNRSTDRVLEVYYTEEHYTKGTFVRID
jgi:hypothetical protein